VAGLALIPATVPIILAGPAAGRAFDRLGGRGPLVIGFVVLAASGFALALAAPEQAYPVLIPGLLLQGLGLGIVLTANDPTGLTAVPERDQGQGAGMINTAEQLGGALGIAALTAVLLDYYWHRIAEVLGARGIHPSQAQLDQGREFILDVEEKGRNQVVAQGDIKYVLGDVVNAHASAYELTFFVAGGIALLGALACFVLVRRGDRVSEGGPIFSRRSRWVYVTAGRSPATTKRPPPTP
jgi:MFS family permease